jgi:Encapsulating protein for peroxidase
MQVAQHVFPTVVTGNETPILADTIDLKTGVPTTGATRAFATVQKPFTLFPVHVADPALTMASNQVTLAGQALALAEDTLFFQGNAAHLPAGGGRGVNVCAGDQEKLDDGLLGIAAKNKEIPVHPGKKKTYGLATYSAVVDGIRQFTSDQQGPPYALILSPDTFGDANLPLEDEALVTPYSATQALLASGPLVMSPGLPARTGLLASLGGKTTTLYIGAGPLVEYNSYDHSVYSFTARESIQFLSIDSRSLIKLKFEEPRP